MTPREPESAVGSVPKTDESRRNQPDPWGVRRAEVLITSLKGVLSSRVVVSPDGEITEIHVFTETGLTPKQVVRNVESALLAQLGIKVDHRRISVAQTAEVLPMEVMEQRVVLEQAKRRPILFQKVEVVSSRPQKVTVQVTLEHGGAEVKSEEESADVPNMRVQAAARATIAALDGVIDDGTVDLAGVKFIDAFDTRFVFVGVSILTGRDTFLHAGSCEIKRGAEQAAAIAVLDATNRWLLNHM